MMDRFEEHSRCDQGLSAKCRVHIKELQKKKKKDEEMNESSAENQANKSGQ